VTNGPLAVARRFPVLGLAFALWLLLLVGLAFIAQGGVVYAKATTAWLSLGTAREAIMPWISRPYVFR